MSPTLQCYLRVILLLDDYTDLLNSATTGRNKEKYRKEIRRWYKEYKRLRRALYINHILKRNKKYFKPLLLEIKIPQDLEICTTLINNIN